jgi:hypothetical protein
VKKVVPLILYLPLMRFTVSLAFWRCYLISLSLQTAFFPIQLIKDVTLVYTPGYFAWAHPIPQLTIPA